MKKEVIELEKELGIQTVTIDLPFRLNHVNCFLAEGEDGWTVIDTGLHNEESKKRWSEVLQNKEVTHIVVTHYHPDHFGYAGGLQQKTNARVSMSATDAHLGISSWEKDFLAQLEENYRKAGVPTEIGKEMAENTASFVPRVTPYPTINNYLEEGDTIVFGNYEYEVIATPGHSDGLIVFYNKEKNVLLSTDHILPKITPNISYWFHGEENPLQLYLDSLEKIKKLNAEYVVPSHGKPFYGANDRIEELFIHHDERLAETLSYVGEPATVFDVSEKLFQKKLTVHETRFAVGETLAHLEYLRKNNECYRQLDEKSGSWLYYR
ncbi:MBL fold metallo-hydrolase [Aliibacillus thermotolerans]|uniref:MBL fold metallo-hydrolase n=1 Tax=Aliibacillus thermotolerans TaxID=1834418 RepID=A0ABW0U5I8_9BACI|nr:MBL fold metallo-hydrolase [Aliibacillus thermotolerans]